MAQAKTVTVGTAVTQVYGVTSTAPQGSVQLINLDTETTVTVGYEATIFPGGTGIPLGPLASQSFDGSQPLYAVASQPVTVAVVPGGSSYSPGSLTITGPVTADISGPVEVEGSIDIGNVPTVELASGSTVDISGTADVNVQNATLDIVGSGGFVLPGQVSTLGQYTFNIPAGSSESTIGLNGGNTYDITPYQSIDFSVTITGQTANSAVGAAYCVIVEIIFTDSTNTIVVGQQTFGLPVANGNPVWKFSVPCLGPRMFAQLQNIGTTATIDINALLIYGSYRNISKFQWNDDNIPVMNSDANVQWISANSPAGVISRWVSSGQYQPVGTSLPTAVLLPPTFGPVNGYFQVNNTAFTNDPVVIDLATQIRGSIVAGTGNPGTLMNIPASIPTPNPPTLFTQNFPVCVPAIILKSSSTSSTLQFTAVQE